MTTFLTGVAHVAVAWYIIIVSSQIGRDARVLNLDREGLSADGCDQGRIR
jgi:hypothetical protein